MKFSQSCLLTLFFSFSILGFAQKDSIKYTLHFKDKGTNLYLGGVLVELYSNKGFIYKGVVSDSIKLQLSKNLKYSCSITKEGYSYEKFIVFPDSVNSSKADIVFRLQAMPSSPRRMLPVLFFNENTTQYVEQSGVDEKITFVKETLNNNPQIKVIIISFSDYNEKNRNGISKKRSKCVYNKLLSLGVDKKRISTRQVKNEPFLVLDETTFFKRNTLLDEKYINTLDVDLQKKARELNRRVEFIIEH